MCVVHHTDGPNYTNVSIIISLQTTAILTFRRKLGSHEIGEVDSKDIYSVVLEPRSLLVFSNDLYDNYLHGIDTETQGKVLEGMRDNRIDQSIDKVICMNKHLCNKDVYNSLVNNNTDINPITRVSLTIRHKL